MKRHMADFVAMCPNFQQVKMEHQRPSGLTQIINITTLKWEDIKVDFVVGFPRTIIQHDSIWVIVDRPTNYTHFLPV